MLFHYCPPIRAASGFEFAGAPRGPAPDPGFAPPPIILFIICCMKFGGLIDAPKYNYAILSKYSLKKGSLSRHSPYIFKSFLYNSKSLILSTSAIIFTKFNRGDFSITSYP
jgi:hypothetical protein